MTLHALTFNTEDANNAFFTCSKCGQMVGFNKPGIGEPCAVRDEANNTWLPPQNPETWMGPCPSEE